MAFGWIDAFLEASKISTERLYVAHRAPERDEASHVHTRDVPRAATNESKDTVAHEATPTIEEDAEEKDTSHVIEKFNVKEERKLSATVDIETLRHKTLMWTSL